MCPFAQRHFPLGGGIAQDEIDQLGRRLVGRKVAPDFDRSTSLAFKASMALVTGMKMSVPMSGCGDLGRGVWCDHPGRRYREHEGAGRPLYTMS